MSSLQTYRWADFPKLLGVALAYVVTAKISLVFATFDGTISLLWIPSGLSLGALLLGGKKLWPAVFIGALVANCVNGYELPVAALLALGNVLEALLGTWLLSSDPQFSRTLSHGRDFFLLLSRAALLGPAISAPICISTLWGFGLLAPDMVSVALLRWWMGGMFSVLLVTPLILIWCHLPRTIPRGWHALELVLLLVLTLAFGQSIFFEWVLTIPGPVPNAFLMFLFVGWSAVRFGRHVTLVVLYITLLQALFSVWLQRGVFALDMQQTGLIGFWIYFVVLAVIGLALAISTDERNASHRKLISSQMHFLAFMTNFPGMAYIKDVQGRYLFVNKVFENAGREMLPPSDYLGKTIEQVDRFGMSEEQLAQIRTNDDVVLQQHQTASMELEFGSAADKNAMLLIKFPLVEDDGNVLIGGITLDISKRKRAEARIERLTHLYQALSEVNQAIVRMSDAGELLPLVCRIAVQYGGVKLAWVGQFDSLTELLVPVAWDGDADYEMNKLVVSARADVAEGLGTVGTAFREDRTVVLDDLAQRQNMSFWRERLERYAVNACASFPIRRNGLPCAVLTVYHLQVDAFDTESVALLEQMARDISFALDNFERERQRREGQAALRASEQHFRAFFERSMVGMATTRTDKTWRDVNFALCELLGYPRDELLQKTWIELTHPDDVAADQQLFKQAMRGEIEEYAVDKRFIRKDGGIVHTYARVRCVRQADGSVDYFVVLIQDVSDKKHSEQLLWRQANFDALTGLPNRHMFAERLELELKKRQLDSRSLALLFIDLDHFKEVNDTLGHAQGDLLLIEAAHRIRCCVRESDTVARLGGDEFMVILTDVQEVPRIETIAHDIMSRLVSVFQLGAERVYVSASIGITLFPADADNVQQLMRNADQAMYAAKNLGRNRFSYFTPELQEAAQARQKLINDLRSALAEQQFQLHFQPIVDLASNRIVKAEALLRWQHPQRGMISPLEFIPLAEETGLIIEIGNWVFREAAHWTRHWIDRFGADLQISVNTSPVEFSAESYNPGNLLDYLHQLGLPGNSIVIEITEGTLLDADPRVIEHFLRFRDAGVQIAVDDFGTGYSSLASLKKFDIDYLKIDQAFVRNLATDPDDRALSEAIIVMAHKLGLQVIAEGVETEQQRAVLAAAGCDYLQGYLFSRPVPAQEFGALLAAQANRVENH